MTNNLGLDYLQWFGKTALSVYKILHRVYSQATLVTQLHTATRYCSADFIDVCILIWGSVRLGEELFQNHILASLQNTSFYRDIHREEWWCCFLPLILDLTIQTKHLQPLTAEAEKEWNLDNGFVFKVRHTQKQKSLSENIHCSRVYNSKRLKMMSAYGRLWSIHPKGFYVNYCTEWGSSVSTYMEQPLRNIVQREKIQGTELYVWAYYYL